jgi:hypothetical protein
VFVLKGIKVGRCKGGNAATHFMSAASRSQDDRQLGAMLGNRAMPKAGSRQRHVATADGTGITSTIPVALVAP